MRLVDRSKKSAKSLQSRSRSRGERLERQEIFRKEPKTLAWARSLMRVDVAAASLRKCRSANALAEGRNLHAQIARAGLDHNTFLANLLVLMYSNCGSLCDAEIVFHSGAAPRNIFSWTILLRGFAQGGDLGKAMEIFRRIPHTDAVGWNVLIAGHGRSGDPEKAQRIFDAMPERDVVSWNAIIGAYSQNRHCEEALVFFKTMDLEGVAPDSISFVSVLDAIAGMDEPDVDLAREICYEAIRLGFHAEVSAGTALIVAQGKIGEIEKAELCFHEITARNAISWNAMLAAYAQSGNHLLQARQLFDLMPQLDVISWTTMIVASSEHGQLQDAKVLFDRMPQRDLAAWNALVSGFSCSGHSAEAMSLYERAPSHDLLSRTSILIAQALKGDIPSTLTIFDHTVTRDLALWNAMITALVQHGYFQQALDLFDSMDVPKNKLSYLIAADACGSLRDVSRCDSILSLIQANRSLGRDPGVLTAVIKMFGRCGAVDRARVVFEEKGRRRDLWNVMISSYAHNGYLEDAIVLFEAMTKREAASWNIVIRAYAQQGYLDQAAVVLGIAPEITVLACNALISAYAQGGYLSDAKKIFDRMEERDVYTWNLMISVYAQLGYGEESLSLFWRIDAAPERSTFLAALDACCFLSSVLQCRRVHQAAIDTGWDTDLAVATSLVAAYGKCKTVEDSKWAFDRIKEPSIVSWNALLRAYAQNGHLAIAKGLLEETMQMRDVVSFNTLAAAFTQNGRVNEAVEILEKKMPCWDDYSHNTMMVAYAQAGHTDRARRLFEKMVEPSTVSWNTMIFVHLQAEDAEAAARLFLEMDLSGTEPDRVSFLSALDAFARLPSLRKGELVHAEIASSRFRCDVMLGNALVSFYARCGDLRGAMAAFTSVPVIRRDVVSWNGIATALAHNGLVDGTLELLWTMTVEGVDPDAVTFVTALSACSHAGLLERGKEIFQSLVLDHGITPILEHFLCLVDLLGRTGRVDEARQLIEGMPIEPNGVAYAALLGACRTQGDAALGTRAVSKFARNLFGSSMYVLLSQLCVE